MPRKDLNSLYPKDVQAYGYIYLITNLLNKKVYVGQTTISINRRFHCHSRLNESNKSMPIAHAIHKHGKHNFKAEIISICSNHRLLDKFEEQCIISFQSQKPEFGYNVARGGQPRMTEAGRKKISAFHKGKPKSKEHIEKVRLASLGLTRTPEQRQKSKILSTKNYGKPLVVFNLLTKTQVKYLSISEAARENNLPKSCFKRLLRDIKYSYNNYKAVLLPNLSSLTPEQIWAKISAPVNCIRIKLTNKLTNEVSVFSNQTKAASFLDVSITTIQRRIDGSKTKTKNLNNFSFERIAS